MSATQASSPPDSSAGTRDRILHVARELIQTRSYLGFSFQDIADAVGIRKASLYHHFATKEALGVEVMHAATQLFKDWSGALGGSPQDKLAAYFQMYRKALHAGHGVCPAGAMAPGWDCINDALRQAVRELRNEQMLWLAGVMGALRSKQAATISPAVVFATCQGGLLAARMTGQPADFDEAISHLKGPLLG
ncbi:TetR/AcrR family transcriptional regulator [Variovorax ginsengisoli]|uniref:TetR/AcrR family transcriptional repressor of nem operon n=1 Tax=Variovorax ginsengisoli TaxID=363844 RepID=A0ABT9S9S1_9BURK|nr:TetR/AcrR family transcriptional regulator [Variovorax ginsengisoli]MDP9901104.1 TetR/AcrR family transcriptional repressor of nem operon [Variovorax ginsengisoli]